MRDILFRGKRKDSGEWEYVKFTLPREGRCSVIPETVVQHTGFTDKNGEMIFEGDILQFDYTGKNLGVNGVAAVVFENGKFGVKWGNYKELVCLDGFANTTLEVIGNIYDNPELLED